MDKTGKKEGEEMNIIAQKISAAAADTPEGLALRIKREAPTLANLAPEQLEQIARIVITQRLARELDTAVDLAGIDWQEKRETFLSDTRSVHTRRAYNAALGRLETWASREGVNPLSMTAAHADQFIRNLKEAGRAAASTRRDIAAVSAFYTFLERYHAAIKNPIRGTRIRPPKENKKEVIVPTGEEYAVIIAAMPPIERAIVETLAGRGLRVGALPSLKRKGEKYTGQSKGKPLEENNGAGVTLPRESLKAIKAAKLDPESPFAWITANALERRVNYHIGKLYQAGKIRAAYSCHDFRHFFAVREYSQTKDIYRVSMLLNHKNVAITQTYLKSLGVTL
jgi:site-specific recombinase XerD